MLGAHLFARFGERWRASRATYIAPAIALAGIVALLALLENLYGYSLHDQWAGVWQIDGRPLLGAAFLIVALGSLASPRWWQILLDNPPLRFLATISYNLYLYHQLVARALFSEHIPPYAGDPHGDKTWQERYTACAFAITIAQAALVTYGFERPLLRLRLPARSSSGPTRAET
jgi:peptidoglycan/LPS O-acetylase OafA/YrhL